MKVSLVSCRTRFDPTQTLVDLRQTVGSAALAGCHLVCYPEFLIGGLPTGDHASDRPRAVTSGGPYMEGLTQLARGHGLSIAAGLLVEGEGALYDSAVLVGAAGELDLHYRRISPAWKPLRAPSDRYQEGSGYQTARLQGHQRAGGECVCQSGTRHRVWRIGVRLPHERDTRRGSHRWPWSPDVRAAIGLAVPGRPSRSS